MNPRPPPKSRDTGDVGEERTIYRAEVSLTRGRVEMSGQQWSERGIGKVVLALCGTRP
jgi:hypothetical protein